MLPTGCRPIVAKIPQEALFRFTESGVFDADWYVRTFPDVASSGMDPAEHFLWLGAKLGRRPHGPQGARFDAPVLTGQQRYDAFFIDGTNGTASTSYRVDLIAQGLADIGWKVGSCSFKQAAEALGAADFSCRFLIIHRAYDFEAMRDTILDLRSRGTVIVYDVDDLVFDLDVLPYVDAYHHMPDTHRRMFERSFLAVREFVLNADVCTTSTEFLANELRKVGKRAYRVRNSIARDTIDAFDRLAVRFEKRPSPFVVGYYSGTKTHQADFAVVAPALIDFMEDHDDVVFRLVGALDLADYPQLAAWARPVTGPPRVITGSLMPHAVMLRDQLTCDLIIAPLEIGNPFCEAKSELKFFEAALARCPVIAAATTTFIAATDGGRLASLAANTSDWRSAFEAIYSDYDAALERAEAAFAWVCEFYSQHAAASEARAAYEDFWGAEALFTDTSTRLSC